MTPDLLIAVVGVCASGKSVLAGALRARGYRARQVSQEHSFVQDMWLRVTGPDLLIYLDAGLQTIRSRRQDPSWPEWIRDRQVARLRHARACCDLYLSTDLLTQEHVLRMALSFVRRVAPAESSLPF